MNKNMFVFRINKFYKICFFCILFGLIFVSFSQQVLADEVTCRWLGSMYICRAECRNASRNTTSGGCGTSCVGMCNTNFTRDIDRYGNMITRSELVTKCRGIMDDTASWTAYGTTRTTIFTDVWLNGIRAVDREEFDIIRARDVCSIADKLTPNNLPRLRSGNCECGEGQVGGIYKVCCTQREGDWIERNAIEYGTQDRFSPREGMCPPNSRVAWSADLERRHRAGFLIAVWESGQLMCPASEVVVPTISLSADPIRITPRESTTLSWTTTGFTTPCNITRVGPGERGGINNVQPNGSATSDPRTTGIHTYTLTCAVTNRPTETRTSLPVTVTVVAGEASGCPSINLFTPVGPPNNIARVTSRPAPACFTCSRCSVNRPGYMASWTDDNWIRTGGTICDDGFNDVSYVRNTVCGVQATPTPTPTPAPTPVISTHNDVHINNFSVSPTCIPQQPTNRREATLSWNVSIRNSCPALPDNPDVSIPVTSDGRCAPASWTSGWTLTSPTSYEASCTAYGGWSGSRSLVGSHSISPSPSSTTTYGLSCSRTDTYTCQYARSYSFQSWGCVRWESYQSCTTTGRPPRRVCVWRSRCIREGCISGSGSVFGSGPVFGPSSSSRETTLAVVQPLDRVDLEPEKDRILHKTFTNISWSSSAPSSSTPNRNVTTGIQCTPSVQTNGDGTGWTGPINSLDSSGTRRISPRRTTTYQLLCRNIYQNNQACYTYRSATQIIRVFDPDLREVPAFYDGFMRLVGRIGNALR